MADPKRWSTIRVFPGMPLELAIGGESDTLSDEEVDWLKDCLTYYRPPIESLEELHDVRERMRTEGPRWWVRPSTSDIVWMPTQF